MQARREGRVPQGMESAGDSREHSVAGSLQQAVDDRVRLRLAAGPESGREHVRLLAGGAFAPATAVLDFHFEREMDPAQETVTFPDDREHGATRRLVFDDRADSAGQEFQRVLRAVHYARQL